MTAREQLEALLVSKLEPAAIARRGAANTPAFVGQRIEIPNVKFTEAELEERRKSTGASEAAGRHGMNGFQFNGDALASIVQMIREKWGAPPHFTGNAATSCGQHVEHGLACHFADAHGFELYAVKKGAPVAHPDYPFMTASVDRLVRVNGFWSILEIKHTSRYRNWGKEDLTTEFPMRHKLQLAHQMFVTGIDHAYLGADVAGKPRLFQMERDPALERRVIDCAVDFWDHVRNHTLPEAPFLAKHAIKGD